MIEMTGVPDAVNAVFGEVVKAAKVAPPDTLVLRATFPSRDVLELWTYSEEQRALFGDVLNDALDCRVTHRSKAHGEQAFETNGLVTYAFLMDRAANPTGVMLDVAQGHLVGR